MIWTEFTCKVCYKICFLLQPKVQVQTKGSLQRLQISRWNLNLGFRLKPWVPALLASLWSILMIQLFKWVVIILHLLQVQKFYHTLCPRNLLVGQVWFFLLIRSLAKRERRHLITKTINKLIKYSVKVTKKKKCWRNFTYKHH